jgi:hypothetical protein
MTVQYIWDGKETRTSYGSSKNCRHFGRIRWLLQIQSRGRQWILNFYLLAQRLQTKNLQWICAIKNRPTNLTVCVQKQRALMQLPDCQESVERQATGRTTRVRFSAEARFSLLHSVQTCSRALSPAIKRPGREDGHSSPLSAEVKNVWAIAPFHICLHAIFLI